MNDQIFDMSPPKDYYFGRNEWLQNLIPKIMYSSARIYIQTYRNGCSMAGPANTLLINQKNSGLFELLRLYDHYIIEYDSKMPDNEIWLFRDPHKGIVEKIVLENWYEYKSS